MLSKQNNKKINPWYMLFDWIEIEIKIDVWDIGGLTDDGDYNFRINLDLVLIISFNCCYY